MAARYFRFVLAGLISLMAFLSTATIIGLAPAFAEVPENNAGSQLYKLALSVFEEPLVATSPTSEAEDAALLLRIQSYQAMGAPQNFQGFDEFLEEYPQSGWRSALLTNLGLSFYRGGYFSRAIGALEDAWNSGRFATEIRAKVLVDRAVGELARMHARLGHADRLEELVQELEDRHLTGPATEALTGAKEGLWLMRHEPGVAYLCGPMALKSLLMSQKAEPQKVQALDHVRSGERGVTLAELSRLAEKTGLAHRVIFRREGQSIPVPSIVHWKVTHFAAIVGESDGYYHVQDPTFGNDLWIARAAIDSEASGYFLVPGEPSSPGWRDVTGDEASIVRGMGNTGINEESATTPDDSKIGCSDPAGMCSYSIHEMVVSLSLNDRPVGYAPPVGPPVYVTITYNQREAGQPANFSWFNVSPKWTLNWLSYIEDNPTVANAGVMRFVAGGGSVAYTGFNSTTNAFAPETRDASLLVRTATTPITYEHRLPDGSREVFARSNGATTNPRRIFLTEVIDPAGNTVRLSYDNQLRLTGITDATGRVTTFSYELPASPLLITKITDPFSRSATISYDGTGRLSQITDVVGLTSRFSYDGSSLVNALTTPYGTTQFAYGQTSQNMRFLEVTDPLGQKERVEFRHLAPDIPESDPANTVPSGLSNLHNAYIYYRNTFYWDKHAYQIAPTDYKKARIKHWTHVSTNGNVTGHTPESIKNPLENRVWFTYPGQPTSYYSGSFDRPKEVGRVLDDGTTQLSKLEYNTQGHVTRTVDPIGRETLFEYDANGIDVLRVKQKISATATATIAEFTYDRHLPLTYKDAAGQVTNYLYNNAGQLLQRIDALGRRTRYEYDSRGYLSRMVNASDQTAASLTYDEFGRVSARTDSEGHAILFQYDALDRLIQETYPDGTKRQYVWNKLDLATVTDRQGRITKYAYDALRRLVEVTDPLDRKTKYGYYANGELKTLTDPNGNVTTWEIDLQSRVTAKRFSDGRQITYGYDLVTGRLTTITDALGQTTRYRYGHDGQVSGVDYVNARNATPNVTFSYDPFFPRLLSMTDGAGSTQYRYVAPGEKGALGLLQEDGPYLNDTIVYQYDAAGRVTARSTDTNETFAYDILDRLTTHTSPLGAFDFTYLGQTGQLMGRKLQGGAIATNWAYETNVNDRRLKSISTGGGRSYEYSTTPVNQITQIVESDPLGANRVHWNYAYDNADRLYYAGSSRGAQYQYAYDPADNITMMVGPSGGNSAGYNNVNQVTNAYGRLFAYDANGNLTEDGERTYKWDAENRLVEIGYKAQPGRKSVFRYDGLGRRTAIVSADGVERRYLWCGEEICQQRGSNDAVSRRYYAEGETAAGAPLFYAQDHLGSVRNVLTGSGVLTSYDYDPYGNPTQSSGQGSPDFRYAGMFYHEESGLYLTQYRVYDPRTGRWLSRDPIGETGGPNLYGYVAGNPITYRDPQGLWIDTVIDLAFITYDIYKLFTDKCNFDENLTALQLDLIGAAMPFATGLGAASRAARRADEVVDVGKTAAQLGKEGEAAVQAATGLPKNTESFVVNGRPRIPDFVVGRDPTSGLPNHLIEAKNVQYQSLSKQLRDYADLVGPGGRVDVAIPSGAKISGPLQKAFDNPSNPLFRLDLW